MQNGADAHAGVPRILTAPAGPDLRPDFGTEVIPNKDLRTRRITSPRKRTAQGRLCRSGDKRVPIDRSAPRNQGKNHDLPAFLTSESLFKPLVICPLSLVLYILIKSWTVSGGTGEATRENKFRRGN